MVTTLTRPETQTGAGSGSGYRSCDGCPRCQNPNAGFCSNPHPQFNGLHPVCKVCGHCVLRGEHNDSGDDLDDLAGRFNGPGKSGHSLN